MAFTPVVCGFVNPVTVPAGVLKAVQVKSTPVTLDVRTTFTGDPEQIRDNGGLFERSGRGLTATIKSKAGPVQPFAEGVMVYVIVSIVNPELTNI